MEQKMEIVEKIPFHSIPRDFYCSILEKMSFKSWMQMLMTCAFLHEFVIQEHVKFKFTRENVMALTIRYDEGSLGFFDKQNIVLDGVNAMDELAGLVFEQIFLHTGRAETDDQWRDLQETVKAFCSEMTLRTKKLILKMPLHRVAGVVECFPSVRLLMIMHEQEEEEVQEVVEEEEDDDDEEKEEESEEEDEFRENENEMCECDEESKQRKEDDRAFGVFFMTGSQMETFLTCLQQESLKHVSCAMMHCDFSSSLIALCYRLNFLYLACPANGTGILRNKKQDYNICRQLIQEIVNGNFDEGKEKKIMLTYDTALLKRRKNGIMDYFPELEGIQHSLLFEFVAERDSVDTKTKFVIIETNGCIATVTITNCRDHDNPLDFWTEMYISIAPDLDTHLWSRLLHKKYSFEENWRRLPLSEVEDILKCGDWARLQKCSVEWNSAKPEMFVYDDWPSCFAPKLLEFVE